MAVVGGGSDGHWRWQWRHGGSGGGSKVNGVSPAAVREALGLASQRITVLIQALKAADIAVPTEFAAELDAAGDKIKALLKAAEK